jgi:hypothetical protein
MAWEKPAEDRPVWCATGDPRDGVPTAQTVSCVTKEPSGIELASLSLPAAHGYQKFTSQDELGHFLVDRYKIRTPKDLTSCEVCHR